MGPDRNDRHKRLMLQTALVSAISGGVSAIVGVLQWLGVQAGDSVGWVPSAGPSPATNILAYLLAGAAAGALGTWVLHVLRGDTTAPRPGGQVDVPTRSALAAPAPRGRVPRARRVAGEGTDMLYMALHDRNPTIRLEALRGLVAAADVDGLYMAVHDRSSTIRLEAVRALRAIGDTDGLQMALHDSDPTVRLEAIRGLGRQ